MPGPGGGGGKGEVSDDSIGRGRKIEVVIAAVYRGLIYPRHHPGHYLFKHI